MYWARQVKTKERDHALTKPVDTSFPKRTKYFISITKGTGYIWPERWNSFSNDNCETTRPTACKTHVSHFPSILFFDCNFHCGLIVKLGPKNIFNEGTEFQLLFTKVIFARVNSLIKGSFGHRIGLLQLGYLLG